MKNIMALTSLGVSLLLWLFLFMSVTGMVGNPDILFLILGCSFGYIIGASFILLRISNGEKLRKIAQINLINLLLIIITIGIGFIYFLYRISSM